jgi:hypothetical protein
VNLEQMDGGANYLQQFTNAFPAGKFPIGVWLQCADDQGRIDADKSAGINAYVGLCHTGMDAINLVRSNGMKVIAQDEWLPEANQLGVETMGWMGPDEIDMTGGTCLSLQNAENARDNTNPVGGLFFNNFGKGVLFWKSDSDAACLVNVPDVPSVDEYWMTDENACGSSEGGNKPGIVKRPGAPIEDQCKVPVNYGWSVQRLRSLISPAKSKPVWNFVELGRPWGEANREAISIPSIRAAAWHSIIAGAMGIEYFAHSFQPVGNCAATADMQRSCPAIKTAVTNLSNEIQGLSSVLFGPRLTSGFSATSNVRALAKWSVGKFYVIAATAVYGGPFTGNFSIGCVGDASATVVGENRSIPVSAGSWTDSFADMNAVHIYRIDGGSTCGLT